MLINGNQLQSLSNADSSDFDKEGYLFVKQKNERLFNQWKTESFVERFVRLKGNLLLIIATKSLNSNSDSHSQIGFHSSTDKCLNLIVLEEFNIKSIDESEKYYEFIIEFNRNETIRCFHFATISHEERDQWIQTIHLSSFRFLKSLYKNLVRELSASKNCEEDSYFVKWCESYHSSRDWPLLSITCHLFLNFKFSPKLIVFVNYRSVENVWKFLGKTEISKAISSRFNRCLRMPLRADRLTRIELKFSLYSIVESLTNTKSLLGESRLIFEPKKRQNKYVFRLDLRSLVRKKSIGFIVVTLFVPKRGIFNNRKNSSTVEEYTERIDNSKERLLRTNSLPNITFCSEEMTNFGNILNSTLFTNTVCKSFQFSIPSEKNIAFIDEFMSECESAMNVPQMFM